MFLHVSVILFTGGWYPIMHCRWYPSMPCRFPGPHPGRKLRGSGWGGLEAHTLGVRGRRSGWGVSRAPGVLQAHTWGSIPACTEADPPTLLLRPVCILLECILVHFIVQSKKTRILSIVLKV